MAPKGKKPAPASEGEAKTDAKGDFLILNFKN